MSSDPAQGRGLLFVISAPSGTGKTTVVERLVERFPRLHRSRSYTSRPARPMETPGVDYNFVSRQTFDEMVRLDLRYVRKRSLWGDIKILLATPAAVIRGNGAC